MYICTGSQQLSDFVSALMYSIFGVMLEWSPLQHYENDDLNSIVAGSLTGLLFKCTRKCSTGSVALFMKHLR